MYIDEDDYYADDELTLEDLDFDPEEYFDEEFEAANAASDWENGREF